MGPEKDFFQWATQIGGPMAGLLLVFFFFYRKDMLEWKGQTSMLIQIVKENTAAFTKNTEVVQSLHDHMFKGERRDRER
jgi:hypothetical protein